jgi:hypothetical protein
MREFLISFAIACSVCLLPTLGLVWLLDALPSNVFAWVALTGSTMVVTFQIKHLRRIRRLPKVAQESGDRK